VSIGIKALSKPQNLPFKEFFATTTSAQGRTGVDL